MTSSTTLTASAFLGTIGVNTHLNYTDGAYFNTTQVLADLQYLGVTQVRDTLSVVAGQSLASYKMLSDQGVTFDFLAGGSSAAGIASNLALIDKFVAIAPGAVSAIEGSNEINNWPITWSNGDTGLQAGLDAQASLYTQVHGDPLLPSVPVYYLTGYGSTSGTAGPDPVAAKLADFDNQHPYPSWGNAPGTTISRAALSNATSSTTPAVFTETGYSTNTSVTGQFGGVSQTVQAKYTLDLLFDAAKAGVAKTYLYDLLDAYAPGSIQGDDGFGLFDSTGAPKLAATALHNLTSILQDPGAGAATSAPSAVPAFSLSGLPATGNSMVIQKSDGSTYVALWAEPQIWNMASGTEIAAPSVTVTLTAAVAHRTMAVFDPLAGTAAITTASGTNTIAVTLTDHPILIELSAATVPLQVQTVAAPAVMATAAVPASAAPLTLTEAQYLAGTGLTNTSSGVTVTGVAVADRLAVERDGRVAAVTVSDTAAHLGGSALATLGGDAEITGIAVSDGTSITLGYADYTAAQAGLAKLATTITVTGTATTLGSGAVLAKLGADSKVRSIAITGSNTLALSSADYTANAAALAKMTSPYQLAISGVALSALSAVEQDRHVGTVAVVDTTAHLTAKLAALGADAKVKTIATSDASPFSIDAAAYAADKPAFAKMASYAVVVTNAAVSDLAGIEANSHVTGVAVSDTASRLGTKLAVLGADAKVQSITVSDGNPIVLNAAGYAAARTGLSKLAAGAVVSVRDNAAALSGPAFDALQAHAAQVGSIGFTDATTPTLTLTLPELIADADLLTKITTPYILNVTHADGALPPALSGITVAGAALQGLELSRSDGSHAFLLNGSGLAVTASYNDTITAAGHNETVSFNAPGFGHDTFSGYAADDHFVLSKSLFANFADLKAHVSGSSDALIQDTHGDTLLLKGVAPSNLTSSMFKFV